MTEFVLVLLLLWTVADTLRTEMKVSIQNVFYLSSATVHFLNDNNE